MPYRVNNGSARGWPFVNHAMNSRGTDVPTGDNSRQSIVYPRQKFTYLVEIGINPMLSDQSMMTDLRKHLTEGRLYATLRSIDRPTATFNVERLRSYNKDVVVPTKTEYSDATINFHDDNTSIASALWLEARAFYQNEAKIGQHLSANNPSQGVSHYFEGLNRTGSDVRYNQDIVPSLGMSLRPNDLRHFLNYIIIYDLGADPDSVNTYVFVNPIIISANHDNMDYEDSTSTTGISMTFQYEGFYHIIGQNNALFGGSFQTVLDMSPEQAAKAIGHALMKAPETQSQVGNLPPYPRESWLGQFDDFSVDDIVDRFPVDLGSLMGGGQTRPIEVSSIPPPTAVPGEVDGQVWGGGSSDASYEEYMRTDQNRPSKKYGDALLKWIPHIFG